MALVVYAIQGKLPIAKTAGDKSEDKSKDKIPDVESTSVKPQAKAMKAGVSV